MDGSLRPATRGATGETATIRVRGTRRGTALACAAAGVALVAASAAHGETVLTTWPASYVWHTFHGSPSPEQKGKIAIDQAGRATLVGTAYESWTGPAGQPPLRAPGAGAHAVILQVDGDGAYRWHTYYPCELFAVAADAAGSLYVTGATTQTWNGPAGQPPLHAYPGGKALVVMKLDSQGGYRWHTFFGAGHAQLVDRGRGVAGEVWVVGDAGGGSWNGPGGEPPLSPYSNGTDAFVLRLSADGAYRWHAFHGAGSGRGIAVAVDGAGDGYVLGWSFAAWNGPAGEAPISPFQGDPTHMNNLFVLKRRGLDGAYLWHTFHGAGRVSANDIAVSGGAACVAGSSSGTWTGPAGQQPAHAFAGTGAGATNIFVLGLDGGGGYRWHTFHGAGGDSAYGLAADGAALYVAARSTATWNGPTGQVPAHPVTGTSSDALVALGADGSYRWHDFVGRAFGQGVRARPGAVWIGGSGAAGPLGPDGQAPLHAAAGLGDLTVMKLATVVPAIVLSDEGSGLLGRVVACGGAELSLREALAWMRGNALPAVDGVVTDGFLDALSTCASGTAAVATTVGDVPAGAAVAVAADCTVHTVATFGERDRGTSGTVTLPATLPGVGAFDLTSAVGGEPLLAWQDGGASYSAFAVAWSQQRSALRRVLPGHRR